VCRSTTVLIEHVVGQHGLDGAAIALAAVHLMTCRVTGDPPMLGSLFSATVTQLMSG
jgi:hypothetical protein